MPPGLQSVIQAKNGMSKLMPLCTTMVEKTNKQNQVSLPFQIDEKLIITSTTVRACILAVFTNHHTDQVYQDQGQQSYHIMAQPRVITFSGSQASSWHLPCLWQRQVRLQIALQHDISTVSSHEVFFELLEGLAAGRDLLVGSHLLLDHQPLVAPNFSLLLLLKPLHLFLTFLKQNKTDKIQSFSMSKV